MDCKTRLTKMAEEEFPGSTVVFDEERNATVRFRIDSASGQVLSRAFPDYLPSQIDEWSDAKLRFTLRALCGFSN